MPDLIKAHRFKANEDNISDASFMAQKLVFHANSSICMGGKI